MSVINVICRVVAFVCFGLGVIADNPTPVATACFLWLVSQPPRAGEGER